MNVMQVIEELQRRYPGKNIIKNDRNNPTEIICEIEPTSISPKQSRVIAVIDRSTPHFHIKATEEYTVLKGNLILTVEGKTHRIPEGQTYIIRPMEHHFARGNSVWVECKSIPGWTPDDHILISE